MTDFSIIIPTYNHPDLARNAITSVLKQQGVTVQIIISDDSVNDEIASLCNSFSHENLLYMHHISTHNAAENWNYGLGFATGEYVILMHHDEYFQSNNHLACLKDKFDTGADIVISNISVTINQKQKKRFFTKKAKSWILRHPAMLFAFNVIGPCACVAFQHSCLQNFNAELSWLVDVEWYFRCLSRKKVTYINDLYVGSQHGHQGQISLEINVLQALKKDIRTIYGLPYCTLSIKLNLLFYRIIQTLKYFLR